MKKYFILSTIFVALLALLVSVQARTWITGTKTVEGEFVELMDDGETVRIKKANGKFAYLAFADLSKADQDFVKSKTVSKPTDDKLKVRTWIAGKHSVEGTFVELTEDGDTVRIKTTNGKSLFIALDALSKEDQNYVKTQNARIIGSGDSSDTNPFKTTAPVKSIPKDNWYAFIVGVDVYNDDEVPKLSCCVSDATALQDKFLNIGFPKENITLLVDTETKKLPSKKNIEKNLKEMIEEIEKKPGNSLIVFSFAGHGIELAGTGACFLPWDVDLSTSGTDKKDRPKLASTVIPVQEISDMLDHCEKAQVKLMIIDACRQKISRDIDGEESSSKIFSDINGEETGMMVEVSQGLALLQSCSYGESSFENPKKGHGYFTLTFLEALNGKADSGEKDGKVTLKEVFAYTSKQTRMRVKDEKGGKQRPYYSFNDASVEDFVFVKVTDNPPPPDPSPRPAHKPPLELATQEYLAGNLQKAKQIASEAITQGTDTEERRQLEELLKKIEDELRKAPLVKATELFEEGTLTKAQSLVDKAIATPGTDPEELSKWQDLKRNIEMKKQNALIYFKNAKTFINAGRPLRAQINMNRALSLWNDNLEFLEFKNKNPSLSPQPSGGGSFLENVAPMFMDDDGGVNIPF